MQDITILSPQAPELRSGIFSFASPIPPPALYSALLAQGIVCAARGGGIRFSPHFYNTEEQLEQALEILKGLLVKRM